MEIWKDIKGYEGIYQVSNTGKIKSIKRNIILKNIIHHYGYLIVQLNKNGVGKDFSVHRLVAGAFIPNTDNLPQVNHKDENKLNNNVENLEWCTAGYNTNYGTRNKRVSKKMTNGKLSKPVLQYDMNGNLIKEWPSCMEVQRKTGFSQTLISEVCNGKYKQGYGYIWKFK